MFAGGVASTITSTAYAEHEHAIAEFVSGRLTQGTCGRGAKTATRCSANGCSSSCGHRIYVRQAIDAGLHDVTQGRTLSQEEVEQRVARWIGTDSYTGCIRGGSKS